LRDLFTKEGNALRILHISSARSIGGGERHLIDLTSGLVERGHEVFVALRRGAPVKQLLSSIAPDHIFEIGLRHALDFGSALKLSKIIRENKIEIVHAHLARDYPLAALAMRHNSGVQLVLTRHVLFPLGKIHVLTFLRVSKIIAVSHAVARALSKQPRFPKEKIRIVHNGIDVGRIDEQLERFDREIVLGKLGLPLHRPLVASVGELNPLKGHEDFIAAASKVALQNGEVDFVIVGDDRANGKEYREKLEKAAVASGLGNRLHFVRWVDELASFMKAADVFVSASYTESFGLAILEAMACATPVVATRTEGAQELIEAGKSGLLVDVGKTDELASAILRLLDDGSLRRRLGGEAAIHARERFGLDRMVEETEKIYAEDRHGEGGQGKGEDGA